MIIYQPLTLTSNLVPSCAKCTREGASEPLSFDEIKAQLIAYSSAEIQAVCLTGFEPFQHPDLVGIIVACADGGITRIGMQTDGGALSNPDAARGCISAGVRFFEITMVAGDSQISDSLTGRQGLFAASMRAAETIRIAAQNLGVPVFVAARFAVCPHNRHQLVAATQAACTAGFDAIRLHDGGANIYAADIVRAHEIATRASVVFFGDGCDFLQGAALYEVVGE